MRAIWGRLHPDGASGLVPKPCVQSSSQLVAFKPDGISEKLETVQDEALGKPLNAVIKDTGFTGASGNRPEI